MVGILGAVYCDRRCNCQDITSRPLLRLSQYTAPNIPTITPSVTIYSSQYPHHYTVCHNIQLPISPPLHRLSKYTAPNIPPLHRLSQYTAPNIPTITPSVTIYSSQYPHHYTVCHNI